METQKAPPKNRCPYGHTFGKDWGRKDDCDECDSFEKCEATKPPPSKPMTNMNDNVKKETITKQIDMEEIFKELRALFACEALIITGSQALKKYGLATKAEDLDIILIKPTPDTVKILKNLQTEFPAATKAQFENETYEDHSLLAIFKWKGLKVDVFGSDGEPYLTIDGFNYATIDNIVNAKLRAGRLKDWLQLRKIASRIWTREGMSKWLEDQEKAL